MNGRFGVECQPNDLKDSRLIYLYQYLKKNADGLSIKLGPCFLSKGGNESLHINLYDIEIPQYSKSGLQYSELFAIQFSPNSTIPTVFALREDFPRLMHTDLPIPGKLVSLCLYDQASEDASMTWSPEDMIHRLREWLNRNARGDLHGVDQLLEPFFLYDPRGLVVLSDRLERAEHLELFFEKTKVVESQTGTFVLYPDHEDAHLESLYFVLKAKPMAHGAINYAPTNLGDLINLLEDSETNLVDAFSTSIPALKDINTNKNACFTVILKMPKLREEGASIIESEEIAAFCFPESIQKFLVKYGFYGVHPETKNIFPLIPAQLKEDELKSIPLFAVRAYKPLRPHLGAILNKTNNFDKKIFAIGCGAIGSHIMHDLGKSGFGRWAILDKDVLLPHNVAKHNADQFFIGESKATTMKFYLNHIFPYDALCNASYEADILRLDKAKEKEVILSVLKESSFILDFSASVPVSRFLANNVESDARRISVFLSPDGMFMTILAEDSKRNNRLDVLEHEVYAQILESEKLKGYLGKGDMLRVAGSCSDITSLVPNDNFELFASIASNRIKKIVENDKETIEIYKLDESCCVERIDVILEKYTQVVLENGVSAYIRKSVLEEMHELRKKSLPNETGGAIIGTYDQARKMYYILDILSAPQDSESSRISFVRGTEGLSMALNEITFSTDAVLTYIGEWHSHPKGMSPIPSSTDITAAETLSKEFFGSHINPVMLICGERKKFAMLVDGTFKSF